MKYISFAMAMALSLVSVSANNDFFQEYFEGLKDEHEHAAEHMAEHVA